MEGYAPSGRISSRKREFYSGVFFTLFIAMIYSVEIKEASDEFSQAYMSGCEEKFHSEKEAEEYLLTFEEWERPMLCIRKYE